MRQRKKQNLREATFGKCEPPDLPAPPVARRLRQRQPLRRGRLQGRQPWRGRNRPERTIAIVAQHVTEDGVPPSLRSVPGASYRTSELGLPPDNAQAEQPPAAVHRQAFDVEAVVLARDRHAGPELPDQPLPRSCRAGPADRSAEIRAPRQSARRRAPRGRAGADGPGRTRQHRSLRPKPRLVFRFVRCWRSKNTAFSEPSRGAGFGCPSTDGDPPCKCCSSPAIRTPPSCAT